MNDQTMSNPYSHLSKQINMDEISSFDILRDDCKSHGVTKAIARPLQAAGLDRWKSHSLLRTSIAGRQGMMSSSKRCHMDSAPVLKPRLPDPSQKNVCPRPTRSRVVADAA